MCQLSRFPQSTFFLLSNFSSTDLVWGNKFPSVSAIFRVEPNLSPLLDSVHSSVNQYPSEEQYMAPQKNHEDKKSIQDMRETKGNSWVRDTNLFDETLHISLQLTFKLLLFAKFHYTLKNYPELSTDMVLKYSFLLSNYSCVGGVRFSSRTYIKTTYFNRLSIAQIRIQLPSKLRELWNIKQWSSIFFYFRI